MDRFIFLGDKRMTKSRAATLLAVMLVMAISPLALNAATVTSYNTYSGWYDSTGSHENGNTNYFTGNEEGTQLNDFFVFDLAGPSGNVLSATLNVYSYEVEASGTYTIYATSLTPAIEGDCTGCVSTYNALTSGAVIGSLSVTPSDSDSWLQLGLNSAGLAWLQANEGGQIVLGGSFPQPLNPNSEDAVFSYSDFNAGNNLSITTSAAPEASTLLLLCTGVLGLAGALRRKSIV